MSIRNDMITRQSYLYKLRLRFFDTDARVEVETFLERASKKTADEMVKEEFLRWQDSKPYVLTGVDVMSTEKVLYGMTPEAFYSFAQILKREPISGDADDNKTAGAADSAERKEHEQC